MNAYIREVLDGLKARAPWETEFLQAAEEVLESIAPLIEKDPKYKAQKILERIVEPERTIMFRVPWMNDKGEYIINRGYRVQFNSAIGPYKGGIRFHPKVTLSTLKFLGFEQTFKNSLTGLPMGGGKGGADFDSNGKSDNEIMRFCQSFMTELSASISVPTPTFPPATSAWAAARSAIMFGQYKRLRNEFTGVLTGKGMSFGGSLVRPEATGFGAVYFAQEMFKLKGETLERQDHFRIRLRQRRLGRLHQGQRARRQGRHDLRPGRLRLRSRWHLHGRKAQTTWKRCSSSTATASRPTSRSSRTPSSSRASARGSRRSTSRCPAPSRTSCPAKTPTRSSSNGVQCVVEVSNMGCTPEAWKLFIEKKIPFAPGKAANAGGVATSGLEMSQNSMRLAWTAEEVDKRLHDIMIYIHKNCVDTAKAFGADGNYVVGANIAGFKKVADAMIAQGLV